MYTLSLDTTAKVASCALLDGEKTLALFTLNNGNTHTENILPMIDDMLKKCSLSVSDIGLIAASAGPGSFTGVRIGASVVKGLAFKRNLPCVEVSTLEALAENLFGTEGVICPVMDARRGQVYNALVRFFDGKMTRLCEDRALSLDELANDLLNYKDENLYFVGDGYALTREYFKALDGYNVKETPAAAVDENAVSVARTALKKYEKGETVSDAAFSPSYLRMSQAERERNEKPKNN